MCGKYVYNGNWVFLCSGLVLGTQAVGNVQKEGKWLAGQELIIP